MSAKPTEHWDTPYGLVYMQSETQGLGGGPRFFFAQWHSTAKPPMSLKVGVPQGFRRKRVWIQIDRWVKAMKGSNAPR